MERRSFLKKAGAGLAAGAAVGLAACGKKEETNTSTPAASAPAAPAAPAIHSGEQIRWRLASSFPKSLDTIFGAAETLSRNLAEATGGKFQLTIHPAGELVPALGVLDAAQQGTVECAHSANYYFFGKDETFAFDCAIPFGMNSRGITAWMYEGNGLKLMREFYAQYNIVNFPMGNTGAQMGGWYRKEIKSVADINGLKMRIGGFGGRVLAKIGGVPQNIPAGEIYQSLEKGTIDAAEWIGPYDDHKLGFHKVAPFYYYPGWWEGGAQLTLMVNDKAYNSLSAEYKAILRQAASDAHVVMQARYDALNPGALKQLIGEGAKLSRFPRDVMDAAFKASREVYAELNDKNPNWKKVYADFIRFQTDQIQWNPIADGSFDQYMAAQKL
ncbi:MAG TPA: TRAP transporter substrate-binding protein [Rhodocyclaceae bacterium]|nr:TRAP transporter substrate-binding protein [Rhodocyclaceae bacterium]